MKLIHLKEIHGFVGTTMHLESNNPDLADAQDELGEFIRGVEDALAKRIKDDECGIERMKRGDVEIDDWIT